MYRPAVHPRAEAPGRAHSPFLLRLVHPFAGLKIVCTSNVARGAPWARHPPAGHERAPNCASPGRSRGCVARYIGSREDDGAGGRFTGAFRGAHRRGCTEPILAHCPALPSGQGRWGQGCLGMESFLHQTSAVFLPRYLLRRRHLGLAGRARRRPGSQPAGYRARRPAPSQALSCARRLQSLPRCWRRCRLRCNAHARHTLHAYTALLRSEPPTPAPTALLRRAVQQTSSQSLPSNSGAPA
jgi:hypothetical protein